MCELPAFRVSDDEARKVMDRYKTIAVVGLSSNPEKPSHFVPKYLKEHGYTVIPVNPTAKGEILGQKVYAGLKDVPQKIEIVDIFRPPKDVPPIVEDAIAIGAKVIWMQEGIVNNAAAERAKAAGLHVIMDKCMMKVHKAR
ncbi:MAG: CoA-binding protein [Nitrospirae bacterium]|nr:CoA-binding protein [Nitrospirota bacterium]